MTASLDRRARKLVQRIQKNHGDHEAVEALAEHYAKAGDQASLANLMEGFGDTLQDAHAAADAYVSAADASLMLHDRARAEALYERALAREPGHAEALDRALRVAESAGDFEGMHRILTSVVRAAEAHGVSRNQLATLHFRLAQLHETHLQDPNRAAALYRSAIDFNPHFVNAMLAARRLYARANNHNAVSGLYELEIEAARLPEDKRALLVALAEHKRDNGGDLNGAIAALRHACKLVPSHLSTLNKLADALIARSERAPEQEGEVDLKRAAEVFYQLARAVPRAEAPPLLLRALALAPEHARAEALLHELHGHAASGGDMHRQLHASVSQRVVDERATRQVPSMLDAAERAEPAPQPKPAQPSEALPPVLQSPRPIDPSHTSALSTTDLMPVRSAADRTTALSTSDLLPLRQKLDAIGAAPAPKPVAPRANANATTALSTSELVPLRSPTVPPPPPPEALRAHASQNAPALPSTPPPADHAVSTSGASSAGRNTPLPAAPTFDDVASPVAVAPATRNVPSPPTFDKPTTAPATRNTPLPPPFRFDEAASAPARRDPEPAPTLAPPTTAPVAQAPSDPDFADDADGLIFVDPVITHSPSPAPTPEPPEEPRVERPTRAQVGDSIEPNTTRPLIEVNLGATTDSNLYVDMGDRIADGGVFIATYQALPPGTPVLLRITLPGDLQTSALGQVTLRRESLDAFEDPVPGMCVSFATLTHEGLALLERFAAKRAPLLIDDD